MARVWTESQKEAIEARNGNFLVAAGAGSGKTAVLTERIRRLVDEGYAHLDELLVLTFTNKAAAEMKSRTRKAFLEEGKNDLADESERSSITTFDAFALSIVKKYHYELGLPADISVLDESLFEIEKRKLIEAILEEKYGNDDPTFHDFVKHFALKDDNNIVEMVLTLLDAASLSGDKEAFFTSIDQKYFNEEFFQDTLNHFLGVRKDALSTLKEVANRYDNPLMASNESEYLSELIALDDYDEFHNLITTTSFPSTRGIPKEERTPMDNAIHSSCGEFFREIKNEFTFLGDENNQRSRYFSTESYVSIFVDLARELSHRLDAFKKSQGAYYFDDIFAFATQAALIPSVNAALRKKYRFIMVDEYQDTSDTQDKFLACFSNENIFAVGDVKQSIYRFRHANPDNFMKKFESYSRGEGGKLIILKENFRSRKEVVDDINSLFGLVMSRRLGDVEYDESQKQIYGNKFLYKETGGEQNHLSRLVYEKKDGLTKAECEARVIAEDIKEKLERGFEVMDAESKTMRPAKPQDFAILIARKRDFPLYARVFSAAKIPLCVSDVLDLSSERVSLVFQSFLNLFAAYGTDETKLKHAYASIKRSYLYEEKDEDIYRDIRGKSYLNDPILLFVKENYPSFMSSTSENGVKGILSSFPFYEKLPLLGEVKDNYEKLSSFLDSARSYDRLGVNFAAYILHFDEMRHFKLSPTMKSASSSPTSTHLMSIHASKGLEFPVVYFPDLDEKANTSDSKGDYLVNGTYGVLLPLTLQEGDQWTYLHYALKNDVNLEVLSERMRLFYVALTRCKEKIVFVEAHDKDHEFDRIDSLTVLRSTSSYDEEHNLVIKASIKNPTSFHEFFYLSGLKDRWEIKNVPVVDPTPLQGADNSADEIPSPELRHISFPAKPVKRESASKKSLLPLDEGALEFGTRIHRLLELTNFITKDVSFIDSPRERKLVEGVVSLPLFDSGYRYYHEYNFFDEKSNVTGSIDLLMVSPSKAIIVDFKSNEVVDEAYRKQLSVYKAYISRVFACPVETYLLSVTKASLTRVE